MLGCCTGHRFFKWFMVHENKSKWCEHSKEKEGMKEKKFLSKQDRFEISLVSLILKMSSFHLKICKLQFEMGFVCKFLLQLG